MLRRLISHPHRPSVHLLIVLAVVLATIVIVLLVSQSAGAADLVDARTCSRHAQGCLEGIGRAACQASGDLRPAIDDHRPRRVDAVSVRKAHGKDGHVRGRPPGVGRGAATSEAVVGGRSRTPDGGPEKRKVGGSTPPLATPPTSYFI